MISFQMGKIMAVASLRPALGSAQPAPILLRIMLDGTESEQAIARMCKHIREAGTKSEQKDGGSYVLVLENCKFITHQIKPARFGFSAKYRNDMKVILEAAASNPRISQWSIMNCQFGRQIKDSGYHEEEYQNESIKLFENFVDCVNANKHLRVLKVYTVENFDCLQYEIGYKPITNPHLRELHLDPIVHLYHKNVVENVLKLVGKDLKIEYLFINKLLISHYTRHFFEFLQTLPAELRVLRLPNLVIRKASAPRKDFDVEKMFALFATAIQQHRNLRWLDLTNIDLVPAAAPKSVLEKFVRDVAGCVDLTLTCWEVPHDISPKRETLVLEDKNMRPLKNLQAWFPPIPPFTTAGLFSCITSYCTLFSEAKLSEQPSLRPYRAPIAELKDPREKDCFENGAQEFERKAQDENFQLKQYVQDAIQNPYSEFLIDIYNTIVFLLREAEEVNRRECQGGPILKVIDFYKNLKRVVKSKLGIPVAETEEQINQLQRIRDALDCQGGVRIFDSGPLKSAIDKKITLLRLPDPAESQKAVKQCGKR